VHDSAASLSTAEGVETPGPARDAAWLADAYDALAEALYAYCRSLVNEPAAAADAVRDTFVVTAARLAELPDESQVRSWVYAVARNECLRAIADGIAVAAPDFLPSDEESELAPPGEPGSGPQATPADGATAPLAAVSDAGPEARALLRAALRGLGPAERDIMAMTWHGLETAESAAVLGSSPAEASGIFARARGQLEASAEVLAVARSGWHGCARLNSMLAGWDGLLTPALRAGLRQHIDRCDACGDPRREGMSPDVALLLAPDALRGVAAGSSRLAAWVTARLREPMLAAAFGPEPEFAEHRNMVARRASPFRDDKFPVPLDPPGTPPRRAWRSPAPLLLAGVGGTGVVVLTALASLALAGHHSTGALPSWTGLSQPAAAPSAAAPSAAGAGRAAPGGASGGASAGASAPATAAASSPAGGSPAGGSPAASTPGASHTASKPAAASPASHPAPKPGSTQTAGPSSPAPSRPPAASPAGPRVNVSPGSLLLQPGSGRCGALTLINPTGSLMHWSVSLPPGLAVFGAASGTLLPDTSPVGSTGMVCVFVQGDGHGHGQPHTETITVQPGNVRVQATISTQGDGG
jgi:RNA polymerase sigma factor (sigma-70 family)